MSGGRESRANARRSWSVRHFRLGEEPATDLSATTTAAERLAMMWPLALAAWTSSGRPIPEYRREETPVRKILADSADGS